MINNHKIQVKFKSIGYGTHDTKEITGTIKLDIEKLVKFIYSDNAEIQWNSNKTLKT